MIMKATESLVKIAFDLSASDSGIEVERLWAKHVDGDVYQIDNSPFQIYGVSLGDKVVAHQNKGELQFVRVVERGGHSTYRVRLPSGRDHAYFMSYWTPLAVLGCTYEGVNGQQRLYAIDVPSIEMVPAVYDLLQANENNKVWEFEEAHYFRPVDTDLPD